jgi:hypothetical protein
MIAFFGGRPADALDLARQASEYADTALHRAQITAWCELSALAALGHHDEPGRFGFDHAELHQHLAEAFLQLGDTRLSAGNHATPPEGPGCRPAQRTPAGSRLSRPARPAANAARAHTHRHNAPAPNPTVVTHGVLAYRAASPTHIRSWANNSSRLVTSNRWRTRDTVLISQKWMCLEQR